MTCLLKKVMKGEGKRDSLKSWEPGCRKTRPSSKEQKVSNRGESQTMQLTILLEELDLPRLAVPLDGARCSLVKQGRRQLDLNQATCSRKDDGLEEVLVGCILVEGGSGRGRAEGDEADVRESL